jgi:hypothetical protein
VILAQAVEGQQVKSASGCLATVQAHGPSGVLVLAEHHIEKPFDGRLIRVRERRAETWSAATEVEPVGQLLLPL